MQRYGDWRWAGLRPDIVWFPAQWPETYSYTLSAALQAGLPVAVPDIGAFAERVAGRAWSWICPWGQDGKGWVAFFTQLRAEHFATSTPPALAQTALAMEDGDDWSYAHDYLAGAPAHAQPPQATPLDAAALSQYLPDPTPAEAARTGAVTALAWLRSLPLLRTVARSIPPHVQRRVKNWLQQ